MQKELEPSTLLRSSFILEAFKALGCLKNLWHFIGHCLPGVLGTILSCVPYAESLIPQLERQVFQN